MPPAKKRIVASKRKASPKGNAKSKKGQGTFGISKAALSECYGSDIGSDPEEMEVKKRLKIMSDSEDEDVFKHDDHVGTQSHSKPRLSSSSRISKPWRGYKSDIEDVAKQSKAVESFNSEFANVVQQSKGKFIFYTLLIVLCFKRYIFVSNRRGTTNANAKDNQTPFGS
jgi:hypothetical protein